MTKRNTYFSLVNRIITIICNFICRSIFIKILGGEYLGAGGMFGNVFSVLSLCELGFGEAVSQAMYKPLASGNMQKVKGLVRYYSKVYRYISLITLALSFAVMPYLSHFFPDIIKISNYRGIYLLFVLHQMLSFYFAPKRSLVMCDQRMYIVMLSRTLCSIGVTVTQIICLIFTGSYFGFIFLRILFLAIDGLFVEFYAIKKYGLNHLNSIPEITSQSKITIKSNTLSLALHRIGAVINNSTDSILLSSYLGLSQMGVFSNYSLIINSLGSFVCLAVQSASASVGNLGAYDNSKKSVDVLNKMTFANFYLLTNCCTILLCLINPALTLWLGKDMCFSLPATTVIIACFYMSYIRDPVQIFLNAYGIFKSTKFIYILRGLLNLTVSFALVKKYGVTGVFGGTLISTVAVPFFSEPYMLFKHGFGEKCGRFIKEYIEYVLSSILICFVVYITTSGISTQTIGYLFLKGVSVFIITNIVLLLMYGRKDEMHYVLRLLKIIK